ncbi:sulfotransferase [Myxococcus eversor]|uniref:sulfotransferase n=1 Tax=Myxococcus eversor TaxID=2709661 RepID=UPI0013D26744|nr:sulfotransferase [Myxococcus eversor]
MEQSVGKPPLYAFVICPNNSGSTLLVRLLATSDQVSVFDSMNHEGQWLVHRDDPEAMPVPDTESEELRNWTTNEAKFGDPQRYHWERIKAVWHRAWDLRKAVLVEKSPPMVVAAPLLQEHFAPARFIVSCRSPYAFAEGVRRKRGYPLATATAHWVRSSRLQLRNRAVLRDSLFFRYEDLCQSPEATAAKILELIPELGRLDVSRAFDIMGEHSPIRDFNGDSLGRMSAEDLKEINTALAGHEDVLDALGYERIEPR